MKKILLLATLMTSTLIATAQQRLPMQLWYDRPATYFEESLPIGNGKLGACVYGGVADNTLYLNDITFWTGRPVDPNLDAGASRWIPKIREALFAEDYALADSLQLHVQGPNSQYFQPLATLHILNEDGGETTSYKRSLDLDSALCHDEYTQARRRYSREYFASYPDKAIAMRIRCHNGRGINYRLLLTSQVPHGVKAKDNGQITLTGHAIGEVKDNMHFCGMLMAKSSDGVITVSDSTLLVRDASDLTIYFVNETSFNGAFHHPVSDGAPYIENVTDDLWHLVNLTYDEMRSRHVADYLQYYNRMSLTLGPSSPADLTIPTDSLLKRHTDNGGVAETPHRQWWRQPFPGNALLQLWALPAHLMLTHSLRPRQPSRSVDTTPFFPMAWQLHRQHQFGGELLARRGCQPQ